MRPIDRLVFTWGEPDAPVEGSPVITLTLGDRGDQTDFVFHMLGHEGKPGDGFIYDGWDEALTNFGRHLASELEG